MAVTRRPSAIPARGAEAVAATVAALAAGVAVAAQPLAALGVGLAAAAVLVGLVARVPPLAAALALVVVGHAAAGPLYIAGWLPESFAALLDLVVAGLFAAAVLRRPRVAQASHALMLAFLALAALAVLNPLVPSLGYGLLGVRGLVMTVVVALAVKGAPLTRRDVRLVVGALALGWAVNVAFAARQWLGAFTPAEVQWIEDLGSTYLVGDQIRLLGAMRSNQDFAFLAAVAVPAVVAFAFRAPTPRARAWLSAFALASLAVLFGSLVRSGLVGGVVGAGVALAASAATVAERRRLLTGAIVAAALLWTAAGLAPAAILPENKAEALADRVVSIFSPGQDFAVQAREQETWPFALRQIEAHPFGAGPGSAGPVSQARPDDAPLGPVVPDNGYLLIAVQLGIGGVLVFVAMLAALGAQLWRRARAGSTAAAAAVGGLAALSVAMFAGSYWSLVAPGAMLGVLVGLGLRDAPAGEETPAP
jgi:O-Antigen ligase